MIQISKKLWIFFYIYINLRYLFFIIDHCKHIGLWIVQRNSSLYQDNYVNDTSSALSMHFGARRKEKKCRPAVWPVCFVGKKLHQNYFILSRMKQF